MPGEPEEALARLENVMNAPVLEPPLPPIGANNLRIVIDVEVPIEPNTNAVVAAPKANIPAPLQELPFLPIRCASSR